MNEIASDQEEVMHVQTFLKRFLGHQATVGAILTLVLVALEVGIGYEWQRFHR